MNRHFVLVATSAMVVFTLTAAAPMASAASGHGLTCKSGSKPMRITENGRHVWRCEPVGHHTTMKSHGATAPHKGGTMKPQGAGSAGGTTY